VDPGDAEPAPELVIALDARLGLQVDHDSHAVGGEHLEALLVGRRSPPETIVTSAKFLTGMRWESSDIAFRARRCMRAMAPLGMRKAAALTAPSPRTRPTRPQPTSVRAWSRALDNSRALIPGSVASVSQRTTTNRRAPEATMGPMVVGVTPPVTK